MSKDDLIALLHTISGAGALIVSFLTRDSFQELATFLKPLGFIVFVMGMFLFTFSVLFLSRSFSRQCETCHGETDPRGSILMDFLQCLMQLF